jgi:hypothetical protein
MRSADRPRSAAGRYASLIVTGLRNTRPSGPNTYASPRPSVPVGGDATTGAIEIVVSAGSAPSGMSTEVLPLGVVTVPPVAPTTFLASSACAGAGLAAGESDVLHPCAVARSPVDTRAMATRTLRETRRADIMSD